MPRTLNRGFSISSLQLFVLHTVMVLFAYKEPLMAPWAPHLNDAGKAKH